MKNKIKTFPIFLIIIGTIILIENLSWMNNAWSKLWPCLLIAIGIISIFNSTKLNK